MLPDLPPEELRVLGCLLEKSVITPDQYPLTLNALTNACNQKSGRNPVMSLEPGKVQRAAHRLAEKSLLRVEENFKTGVEKYHQRFCNTTYNDYRLDGAELAVMCLLLLRGPQTPGELKAHSGRLHAFADIAEVTDALARLMDRDGPALVASLPRRPGRRDFEYVHLLGGAATTVNDAELRTVEQAEPAQRDTTGLAERVARLEAEVAELREVLRSRTGETPAPDGD